MERACNNLNEYLAKYKLHQRFTLEEFEHWFLPRKDIVYSYVVEVCKAAGDGILLFSFYIAK